MFLDSSPSLFFLYHSIYITIIYLSPTIFVKKCIKSRFQLPVRNTDFRMHFPWWTMKTTKLPTHHPTNIPVRIGKTNLKFLRTPLGASLEFKNPPRGEHYNLVTCLGKQRLCQNYNMKKKKRGVCMSKDGPIAYCGANFLNGLHHLQNLNYRHFLVSVIWKQTKTLFYNTDLFHTSLSETVYESNKNLFIFYEYFAKRKVHNTRWVHF